MRDRALRKNSGVTLIEVTMAVAIFAVVIAVSAQSIMSFYVALDVQQDRVTATHSCRTVLNAIREKRGDFRGPNETDFVNWTSFFSWISTQNNAGWSTYLIEQDGTAALTNHRINVTMQNMTGNAAVAGDNPIEVHVTATWRDGKGRTTSTRVVTRMTDR